jgi:hypothetical protein
MPFMAGMTQYPYGKFGLRSLTLSRITGQFEYQRKLPDGTETFSATCKRTNKLF